MNAETFCEHFATFADAPNGVEKLRALILQLAVQGKLVPQDRDDQPASALITAIVNRKAELIRSGQIPNESALPPISQDDVPFRLPSNWKWIRLETVCEAITKGSSPKWQGIQYVDASDGVLFVTSENVGNYVLRKMDEPKFVERRFNEMEPRSILQRDDVLVNLVGGSIGRSALFDRDDVANINQAVGIIRLVRGETSIDRWYLLHYLNSPISLRIMLEEQVETARANLSLTNMKHFLVPLPPLAEQRRIVEKVDQLLGLCDELAARQTAQREKRQRLVGATLDRLVSTRNPAEFPTHAHRLRNHFDQLFDTPTTIPQLRQTIMQLAVQGQLVPQDPNDEPAGNEYRTANFTSTNDNSCVFSTAVAAMCVPRGWTIAPLNNVCIAIVDCPHSTPKWTEAGKICVRTNQFRAGRLDLSQPQFVNESTYADRIQRLKPAPDDILYSREGGILGIACRIPAGVELCLGQRMMLFRAATIISAEFLEMVLNSPLITEIAKGRTTGGAAPRVNVATVKAYPIPLPPLAEQKRIVTKVTELLSLCDALEAKLTQAESASTQLLSAAIHQLLTMSSSA